jgi:hypothetical protein
MKLTYMRSTGGGDGGSGGDVLTPTNCSLRQVDCYGSHNRA